MARGGWYPQQGRMVRIASALGLVMFSVALLILSLISYVSIKKDFLLNSPRSGLSGGPRMFHAGARWVQVGLCCSCWLDVQWALSAVLHKKQVNLFCTSMTLLMWYLLCLNHYKYLFDNLYAHVYSVCTGRMVQPNQITKRNCVNFACSLWKWVFRPLCFLPVYIFIVVMLLAAQFRSGTHNLGPKNHYS